jgi:hypothetical protein
VLPAHHTQLLSCRGGQVVPEFGLELRRRSPLSWPRGQSMGELFFLISCVAAFAAGLAIAGMSLFG